jgi:hypothetical protein
MKRRAFLNEFLGALGAADIIYVSESDVQLSGTVIYEPDDPEETQDFCWHMTEEQAPEGDVLKLARLLNGENLLSIDKISISRDDLLRRYNEKYQVLLSKTDFEVVLENLESLEINMVDDGKETDIYFIHE